MPYIHFTCYQNLLYSMIVVSVSFLYIACCDVRKCSSDYVIFWYFLKIVGLILRFCDLYGRGIFGDSAISALPWHYIYYKEKNVYLFLFSLFIFTNIWHLSLENTKWWFVYRTTDNHFSRHIGNYLARN